MNTHDNTHQPLYTEHSSQAWKVVNLRCDAVFISVVYGNNNMLSELRDLLY